MRKEAELPPRKIIDDESVPKLDVPKPCRLVDDAGLFERENYAVHCPERIRARPVNDVVTQNLLLFFRQIPKPLLDFATPFPFLTPTLDSLHQMRKPSRYEQRGRSDQRQTKVRSMRARQLGNP